MPPKACPSGKILNPATNRCVKIDGKIGKAILAAAAAAAAAAKSSTASKSPTPKKQRLLKMIAHKCNNDSDPISMESFADMNEEQLESLVFIGKNERKNCYLLENIYEVYKTAVMSKKPVRDPMDPSHELTVTEIKKINDMMKRSNPSYKTPKYESPKPYPKDYELEIELSPLYANYFAIKIYHRNQIKFDLGLIPGWIETNHTGSADYTTGVLMSNIRLLWEKSLLMSPMPSGFRCCNVQLRKSWAYWQGPAWKTKFIQLCEEVKTKLED